MTVSTTHTHGFECLRTQKATKGSPDVSHSREPQAVSLSSIAELRPDSCLYVQSGWPERGRIGRSIGEVRIGPLVFFARSIMAPS